MYRKLLIPVFAALVLIFASATTHSKTLVYCSEGSPSSFNPQVVTDGTSINAGGIPLFNRLVEFEYGKTNVIPALAESWQISKDNLTYTFKLRKGVKFHSSKEFTPTRDLTSEDVVWSFERMSKKDHPYNLVGGGTYEYFDSMEMGKLVKSFRAIDPLTIEIVLNAPESPFLANLAMPFMGVLSKEYGDFLASKNRKAEIDSAPIGTGPFVLLSYQKDSTIRYGAFEKYWGLKDNRRGNIDKLIFSITPDANVRTQKLKTGECQFIAEPAPADLPALKSAEGKFSAKFSANLSAKSPNTNSRFNVMQAPGLNVGFLAMNVTKKPFDNVLVRQALNHALNRKQYIDAIFLGHAEVAKNPLPPTIWSYNKNTKDYDYDPKKAKELLKKAGLENGFETEMWTMPVSRPYNPNGKKLGEMMQADLEKVGIKVKLITYDWATYLAKSKTGDYTIIQFGWTGDNGDPDNFLNVLLGCAAVEAGSNYARWCDKNFNDLITEAKRTSDMKKRTLLYEKAQLRFKEQAPWVTIAHTTVFRAMSQSVKGYKMDPFGGDIFTSVNIE